MCQSRIVAAKAPGHSRFDQEWFVVEQNIMTGRPMASLELHWQGEYPHRTKTSVWVEGLTHHAMLKGEALRWARRYAAERGQKFSDKSDLINLDDLRTGPLRNCLL